MAIRWARSADRHGIDREDAKYAIANRVYWLRDFDEPRIEGGKRPDLFIGPSGDGKQLLEVMAEVTPPRDFFIFHVMNARPKIIEKARRLSI